MSIKDMTKEERGLLINLVVEEKADCESTLRKVRKYQEYDVPLIGRLERQRRMCEDILIMLGYYHYSNMQIKNQLSIIMGEH